MKKFSFSGLNERTNKEQILAKVRRAVMSKDENLFSDVNFQIDTWAPFSEDDGYEFTFIDRFKKNDGIFVYFENDSNFVDALKQYVVENEWNPLFCTSPLMKEFFKSHDSDIEFSEELDPSRKNTVAITDCECLIAQTGSIVVSDRCAGSKNAFSNVETLLVFARPSQFVEGFKDAIKFIKEKYQNHLPNITTIISGPSRSIEFDNQLVIGAQGIKSLGLFLVDE